MAEITLAVPPAGVHKFWPIAKPWIEAAYLVNPSDETFEEIERDVLNGDALLWLAADGHKPKAAAITKLWGFGGRKICSVMAAGGRGENWPELLKPIEDYAKAEGCEAVRIGGRQGWARVFRPHYQHRWTVLEKRL